MSLQNILDGVASLEGYKGFFYEKFLADIDVDDRRELFGVINESLSIISDLLEVAECARKLLKERDRYSFDELQRAMERISGLDARDESLNGKGGPAKARAILFGSKLKTRPFGTISLGKS